ncbi:rotatin-like, partial [Saccoglossus kowalevskii]
VTLHQGFLKHDGLEMIIQLLRSSLVKPADSKEQELVIFIPPCLSMLRRLIHQNYSLRHQLAHDITIYFILIRCSLLFSTDDRVRYESAHILTLLLFDEVASLDSKTSSPAFEISLTGFSLPKTVVDRYSLPFKAHSHHIISPYRVVTPLSSDPLRTGPPADMLTMGWNIAWHHGIELLAEFIKDGKSHDEDVFASKLYLSKVDKIIVCCSHTVTGIKQCLDSMLNASSHYMVKTSLMRLVHYIVTENIHNKGCNSHSLYVTNVLYKQDWKAAFGRYLQVIPANTDDESLLSQLLFTLSEILDISQSIPEDFYIWLADIIIDNHAPLTRLIQKSDNSTDVNEERTTAGKRGLQKSILVFLNVFAKRLSKSNHSWKFSNGIGYIGGEIVHSLVQSLNLADAVHFYDLPSLECTLQCLLHVTARSGWSNGSRDLENLPLCHKFLSSLLEIVSAFHVGRGGTAMSYMGKGVTRCATLCLLHLAYEMSQHSTDKTWTSHWLYIRQGNQDEVMNTGLLWLLALWYYRDPEVRTTGLGIATALASTESGRIMLSSCCQQIPGGIWGTVLTFLLDQSECSIVRQQAAALFVNLTSQSMPDVAVSDPCIKWQGPSVQDEDTHISLVGLPALIALLHHYQFYTEMPAMISNYYADSTITPVSILDNMSTVTTSTTTATSASPSTLITTVDNDALNGSNGANITQDNRSTMYTSTPNTTHRTSTPSTSIASMQTNSSKRSSQSQVSSSSGTDASQDTASSTVLSTTEVRYPSVVTPSLIGTLCQLLRNLISLAPHDATMAVNKNNLLTNLLRLLDVDLLEGSLQQLDGKDGILLVDTLLQMYSDVLLFVKAMLQSDTPTRLSVLEDTIVWRKCLQLLSLAGRQCIKDCCLELSCHMLVSSVFSLLTSMVQLEESRALKAILPSMAKYWKTIIDCIVHVIRSSTSLSSTRVSVLKYITVLLTVEGVKQTQDKNIMFLMDGDKNSSVESDESVSSGQILCEVLLSAYDCTLPTSNSVTIQEKHLIGSALSTLLAVSHTAKTFALEAGLVESTIDQIKHIHVKLNMDSLQIGKTSSKKKQEDSQISELMNHLNLLRNFLYNSEEVKMAAYECGFSNVVHKLWSWCTVESQLMMTVLAVLCTYTARCEPACSSLAFTSLSAVSGSGPSSNSLLHSLVKYANRENSKQKKGDCSENQKSIFSLLSTLALSSECRGILWKSNFLQLFSKVPPPKKGGKGRKLNVSLMWLKLLVNLSFSAEGQQMIMKIPECLDLLLDYGQCSYQAVQMAALLILRNLCLHATSKPKLLSNDKLLPYLLDVVNGTNMHSKYIAVTALWALVYNSQKAKVSMKNGAVGPNLMEAYSNVKSMSYNPTDEQQDAMQCLNAMQTVIAMVNE